MSNFEFSSNVAAFYLSDKRMKLFSCFHYILREGLACVPRGYLTYMAPEILRTLMIDPPILYMKAECTKESDVFAFG